MWLVLVVYWCRGHLFSWSWFRGWELVESSVCGCSFLVPREGFGGLGNKLELSVWWLLFSPTRGVGKLLFLGYDD